MHSLFLCDKIIEMRVFRPVFVVFCFFLLFTAGSLARAQDVPPTCEEEYLDVLKERAWMEGKREMELAQRLILKPDSTLEYSCFRDRVNDLATKGADWSNGDPWQDDLGNVPVKSMNTALNNLVRQPLNNYLSSNFWHSYGGGTGPSPSTCKGMYIIFDFLKCHNFNKDNFKTFEEIMASDPRDKPNPCNEPGRQADWQDALDKAFPDPATPAADGGMDALQSLLGNLWGQCNQVDPIPTGVMVKDSGPNGDYEEHICIPPGCSYNGSQCQ